MALVPLSQTTTNILSRHTLQNERGKSNDTMKFVFTAAKVFQAEGAHITTIDGNTSLRLTVPKDKTARGWREN